MNKELNLQYLLAYFGILPFFFILLDKFFFHKIEENILINFSIYYSLIIFVFIGATNWNLKHNIPVKKILHGILPSISSLFLIILHLYSFNIFIFIMLFFIIQLILDFFLVYETNKSKYIFYKLRVPLTILVVLSLFIIKF